jgi:hypothetical protein
VADDAAVEKPLAASARTIQECIDAGLMQTFQDAAGRARLRLTDRGWALAEQMRRERGDDVG